MEPQSQPKPLDPQRAACGPQRNAAAGDAVALRALAGLDISVITRPGEAGERLIRELQRLRCRVTHVWPAPEQISIDADVVFCDLMEDLPRRLPWLPGEPGAALVVLIRDDTAVDFRILHNCAPHAVLHQPASGKAIQCNLMIAREHFLYERRLRGRIGKLDDNLRTMRSVERAKTILMHKQSLSEEEAYHHLRRLAMEKRKTIGAVATAVVDSQELLG